MNETAATRLIVQRQAPVDSLQRDGATKAVAALPEARKPDPSR
jgi:hypothetical protein